MNKKAVCLTIFTLICGGELAYAKCADGRDAQVLNYTDKEIIIKLTVTNTHQVSITVPARGFLVEKGIPYPGVGSYCTGGKDSFRLYVDGKASQEFKTSPLNAKITSEDTSQLFFNSPDEGDIVINGYDFTE